MEQARPPVFFCQQKQLRLGTQLDRETAGKPQRIGRPQLGSVSETREKKVEVLQTVQGPKQQKVPGLLEYEHRLLRRATRLDVEGLRRRNGS